MEKEYPSTRKRVVIAVALISLAFLAAGRDPGVLVRQGAEGGGGITIVGFRCLCQGKEMKIQVRRAKALGQPCKGLYPVMIQRSQNSGVRSRKDADREFFNEQ